MFKVSDSWTERTAGGCANHVQTYRTNPRYRLNLESVRNDNYLFVELKGPKQFDIGFSITISSLSDPSITAPFQTQITKPYR